MSQQSLLPEGSGTPEATGEIADGDTALPQSVAEVLGAILDNARDDAACSFQSVSSVPTMQRAAASAELGDFRGFYFDLQYPFEQVIDGLLEVAFPKDHRAQFLMRNSQFVQGQFRGVIERHEGRSCCTDKAGFLMSALLRFFRTGQEIVIDRDQEFTYHVPKALFQSHAEIMAFFDAVRSLWFGRASDFVIVMADLEARGRAI